MTSQRSRIGGLIALILMSLVVLPAAAFGATKAVGSTPQAGGSIDLQTWPENGQLVVVTAVTVPPSVKLPTVVRVPLVTGSTVQWAGEVLGGDVSADPAREYKIVKSPVGGSYVQFTLETTRSAQVDAVVSNLITNGNNVSGSLEWIQSAASPSTSFSVRTPADAGNVQIVPKPSGPPDVGADGENLWGGDPLVLAPGQTQTISLAYTVGQPSASAASGSVNTLVFLIEAALAIAVIVTIVLFVRQRQTLSSEVEEPVPARPSRKGPSKPEKAEEPDSEEADSDDDWGFDDTE